MPSMASITVKKFDGTTDIIYDALSASGGDNSPAVFRQDTGAVAGLPVGHRAQFKVLSRWNGSRSARLVELEYSRPYATQDSTTTVYSSKDRVVFKGVITCPQGIPATDLNEACYQFANLVASTLVKQSMSSGYAPT